MAIDTENKRRSVHWILPVPDGTIGAADRAQVKWIYSGIAVAAAAAGPVEALETALYSALSGDADLVTELGGTVIYNKRAAQSPGDKYAIMRYMAGGDENESPHRTRNVLYAVFGVAGTPEDAAAIDAKIDAVLHHGSLSISGWTQLWIARENVVVFVQDDAGGVARHHAGAVYRIRMEKN